MKQIKKLVSVMLSLAMVFAMSATAFAADTDEPATTSDGDKKVTHTYEIYQIFMGDYAEVDGKKVLSNIKWGSNGTDRNGKPVDEEILKELETVQNSNNDTEKLAIINKYANLKSTPVKTGTVTKYEGLTPGYYLVKDQNGSLDGTNEPYTLYVVQVVNDTLTFTPKGDVPTTDKKS